ncbi:hypothetical protein Hanom_Chr05g00447671 [Helianthus anomalus]
MDIDWYRNPSSAHSYRCLKHQLEREREGKPWFFSMASRSPCDSGHPHSQFRGFSFRLDYPVVVVAGGIGCPLTMFSEVHLDYLECFHRPGCWAFALNACIEHYFIYGIF